MSTQEIGSTTFNFPAIVDFGFGASQQAGLRMRELGGRRPLVVADATVHRMGLTDPVIDSLRRAGFAPVVFDGVEPEPAAPHIQSAVEAYKEHARDSLVAIGGGSALDVGKAAALLAAHGGSIRDYDCMRGGMERIRGPVPPLLAVPTTAGTGSEMSGAVVIANERRDGKVIVMSPLLKPRAAVLDPSLTRSLPQRLTAVTGFDALSHAIEALCVDVYHPWADALALEAIHIIAENLPAAHRKGNDAAARANMLWAAAMAGAAMSHKGLGAAHALAHQLAGVPHGLANAVMLPHVVEFNLPAATDRLERAARAFGAQRAQGLPSVLTQFASGLGLETRLRDAGIDEDAIRRAARAAMVDPCRLSNPRPCGRREFMQLLQAAS